MPTRAVAGVIVDSGSSIPIRSLLGHLLMLRVWVETFLKVKQHQSLVSLRSVPEENQILEVDALSDIRVIGEVLDKIFSGHIALILRVQFLEPLADIEGVVE